MITKILVRLLILIISLGLVCGIICAPIIYLFTGYTVDDTMGKYCDIVDNLSCKYLDVHSYSFYSDYCKYCDKKKD